MVNPKHKLPDNAKLVFKGIIFEFWQWEQKMYDGSVATFERIKRSDTTHIISLVGDKILIQIQEQPDHISPYISFPGGRVDDGEEPLAGAQRELLEEAGYVSEDWQLWQAKDPYNKIQWTIYTFIARNCTFKQEPQLDGGEKISLKLISFAEFLQLAEDPDFYDTDFKLTLLKAKYDQEFREEFFKKLFS